MTGNAGIDKPAAMRARRGNCQNLPRSFSTDYGVFSTHTTCIDVRRAITYNKIMIIDEQAVLFFAASGNIAPCNYNPPSASAVISQ
jgi:hypothetical protein